MRVLYLSAWFPYPPDNGARIRAYHLLAALANEDVHLISLMQEDSNPVDAHHLTDICSVFSLHTSRWFESGTLKSALGFLSLTPRSVVSTYDQSVACAVRQAVSSIKPDVIVASTIGAAVYVPHDLGVPAVLDEHNCEFTILKRAASSATNPLKRFRQTLGWKKAERWESRVCRRFSAITIVSEPDRAMLLQSAPDLRSVHVVPNGVDTAHYSPDARHPSPCSLLYNGALTYGANLDAVRFFVSEIYPILAKTHPEFLLRITGRATSADLSGVEDCPNVQLTGYVNDIRAVLQSSAVCIVPLRQGGGSRLKILEAMAAGLPVVSTTIGAEGLDVANGTHLLIADSPGDFADAISRLLDNHLLGEYLSTNARRLVETRYSWQTIGKSFAQVVGSAVHS